MKVAGSTDLHVFTPELEAATSSELMSIIVLQDSTIYSFIIFSADSSTFFG